MAERERVAFVDVPEFLGDILQLLILIGCLLRHHPVHSPHCFLNETSLHRSVFSPVRDDSVLVLHEAPRGSVGGTFLF